MKKQNYTQAYKELKELEVERTKLDVEQSKEFTKAFTKIMIIIAITAITISFLFITLGSHFKGEMNCTINGVNYKNIDTKILEQYNNPSIELKDSAISCSFKGDIPTYALLVIN